MGRNAHPEYAKEVHMGYKTYEEPTISGIVYYYDTGNFSSLEFCEKVLLALKNYGYDDITNIVLGKHKLIRGILKDYTVQYSKKDLSILDLKTEMFKWINDDEITSISFVHKDKRYWMWGVTWYKNYKMPDGISISDYTFNYLQIASSYERLDNKDAQNAYTGLFCNLSDLFESFYGRIEDVSTAVDVLDRTKEKVFNHKYIQAVYWGNYLGEGYCLDIGQEKLKKTPFDTKKQTNRGVFLAVTDDLFDSKNNPNFRKRKKLLKYLTK